MIQSISQHPQEIALRHIILRLTPLAKGEGSLSHNFMSVERHCEMCEFYKYLVNKKNLIGPTRITIFAMLKICGKYQSISPRKFKYKWGGGEGVTLNGPNMSSVLSAMHLKMRLTSS